MFEQLKKFVESMLLFQMILLVVFILFNFDSLDEITIRFEIGNSSYDVVINLLTTTIVSIIIYVSIIVISSLNVLGSGLSETGIRSIAKFCGLITLFTYFTLAETWLFGTLSYFGTILFIFNRFADILYFVMSLEES